MTSFPPYSGANGGGGGGTKAPNDATYLVLTANADLTSERIYTPGQGLAATDAGPGSTYTVRLANSTVQTTAPSTSNDSSQGYFPGFTWANSSTNLVYYCVSAAIGAAVWVLLTMNLALTAASGPIDNLGSTGSTGSLASAGGSFV